MSTPEGGNPFLRLFQSDDPPRKEPSALLSLFLGERAPTDSTAEVEPPPNCAVAFDPNYLFWSLRDIPVAEAVKSFMICGAPGSGKTKGIQLFLQSIAPRLIPSEGAPPEQLIMFEAKAAKAWLKSTLHQLRHGQEARVVKKLEDLLNPATPTSRTTQDQVTLTREVSYFKDHEDHLHYRRMAKFDAPMGSGAVESLGKQFQRRLRGCGQFWTRPGITHLLQLCVLVKNKDHHLLWN